MSEQLLTQDILAERWHRTIGYLAKLRCSGKGPSYIKIGRQVLYRIEDIEAFEERRLHLHTSQDFLQQVG
jgi:hypothetical protein